MLPCFVCHLDFMKVSSCEPANGISSYSCANLHQPTQKGNDDRNTHDQTLLISCYQYHSGLKGRSRNPMLVNMFLNQMDFWLYHFLSCQSCFIPYLDIEACQYILDTCVVLLKVILITFSHLIPCYTHTCSNEANVMYIHKNLVEVIG